MTEMERAMDVMERALDMCGGDQAEARLVQKDEGLTRFSRSRIHQSVSRVDVSLSVRVIVAGAAGIASTNQLDEDGLRTVTRRAEDMARQSRPDPGFRSLPVPAVARACGSAGDVPQHGDEHDRRAAAVAAVSTRAARAGAHAHGYVASGTEQVAVANSLGIRAHHLRSRAGAVVLMEGEGRSGYASGVAARLDGLDVGLLGERALDKWERGKDPVEVEPGEYEVILEPEALRDLLFTLAPGFDARAVEQGRSFLSGRMNERVVSPLITLSDDGTDPAGLPMPFDFEGVPRQKLRLLVAGVPRDLAVDSYTAYERGSEPTGHTLPPDAPFSGALPLNLFLDPGDAGLDDMIASTTRGLLITRLWYHRVINPRQTLVTGLTRDGTFLVERGRITRAVHNLRYTDTVLGALSAVEALGGERELKEYGPGGLLLPAAKLTRFRFTGTTTA